jgi:hypothetical protein
MLSCDNIEVVVEVINLLGLGARSKGKPAPSYLSSRVAVADCTIKGFSYLMSHLRMTK